MAGAEGPNVSCPPALRLVPIAVVSVLVGACLGTVEHTGGDVAGTTGAAAKGDGTVSTEGGGYCLQVTNAYRGMVGKAPLRIAADLEAYAAHNAQHDAEAGSLHRRFLSDDARPSAAENEVVAQPAHNYTGIPHVIDFALGSMFAEGPGGVHYEILVGDFTELGCATYDTGRNSIWFAQEFR